MSVKLPKCGGAPLKIPVTVSIRFGVVTVPVLGSSSKDRHRLVRTINGKAELVVQDAEAYQALLDRVEAIEGIQRGLADVKAGRAAGVCSAPPQASHTALRSPGTRKAISKSCI
jgi:hypothetical protein